MSLAPFKSNGRAVAVLGWIGLLIVTVAATAVFERQRLFAELQAEAERECHELCVSIPVHAGFSYGHALKRSSNMIANWLRAANHSLTFLPPFSKLRIAR